MSTGFSSSRMPWGGLKFPCSKIAQKTASRRRFFEVIKERFDWRIKFAYQKYQVNVTFPTRTKRGSLRFSQFFSLMIRS